MNKILNKALAIALIVLGGSFAYVSETMAMTCTTSCAPCVVTPVGPTVPCQLLITATQTVPHTPNCAAAVLAGAIEVEVANTTSTAPGQSFTVTVTSVTNPALSKSTTVAPVTAPFNIVEVFFNENGTDLPAGTYNVVATNSALGTGVEATSTVTISSLNIAPTISSVVAPPPACFDGVGNVTVNIANGNPPFAVTLSNSAGATLQTINTIFNTATFTCVPAQTAGTTLNVTVTDFIGCTFTATGIPFTPSATAVVAVTTATGTSPAPGTCTGTLPVCVTGGTPPYTVTIVGTAGQTFTETNVPATTGACSATNNSFTFTGLAADTYSINAVDVNGCTSAPATGVVTPATAVTAPTIASIAVTPAMCFGTATGVVDLTVTPATATVTLTGQFSGTLPPEAAVAGVVSFDTLYADTYKAVVSANGTSVQSCNIVVTQPSPLVVRLTPSAISCPGEPIVLTAVATGGTPQTTGCPYTYAFSPAPPPPFVAGTGTVSVSPSVTTTYTVTATDANMCTATSIPVTIEVVPCVDLEVSQSVTQATPTAPGVVPTCLAISAVNDDSSPSAATGVLVTVILPQGFTITNSLNTQPNWTFSVARQNGQTVIQALYNASLAPGQGVVFYINGTVACTGNQILSSFASITSNEYELNDVNNTSRVAIPCTI